MTIDRAIEILNPEPWENYGGLDEVNEACRMGMEALERGRNAVPVVRCRDCKNWEPYGSKAARNIGDPLERYGGCKVWHGGHLESDFCSYGEKKEDKNGRT